MALLLTLWAGLSAARAPLRCVPATAVAADDARFYVFYLGANLTAFDGAGAPLWAAGAAPGGPPVAAFAVGATRVLTSDGRTLRGHDKATGAVAWEAPVSRLLRMSACTRLDLRGDRYSAQFAVGCDAGARARARADENPEPFTFRDSYLLLDDGGGVLAGRAGARFLAVTSRHLVVATPRWLEFRNETHAVRHEFFGRPPAGARLLDGDTLALEFPRGALYAFNADLNRQRYLPPGHGGGPGCAGLDTGALAATFACRCDCGCGYCLALGANALGVAGVFSAEGVLRWYADVGAPVEGGLLTDDAAAVLRGSELCWLGEV
jgi:hypothetical protein